MAKSDKVNTWVVWSLPATRRGVCLAQKFDRAADDFEWADAMNEFMDWAYGYLKKSEIFMKEVYPSNWVDAENTYVRILGGPYRKSVKNAARIEIYHCM